MSVQRYFPSTEGDQIMWFNNLASKIAAYYTALGIGTADQAMLTSVLAWLVWSWAIYLPARRHEGPAATAWRNRLASSPADPGNTTTPPAPATLTPPTGAAFVGMLTWLFDQIAIWKKAPGYTDTIGEDLGIIGPEMPPSDPTAAPTAKAEVRPGEVILTFSKRGHLGVWIESQVGSETAWSFLAIDTTIPYNDTRPLKVPGQPEMRRYRLCYWDNVPSNAFCDTIEVTFGG